MWMAPSLQEFFDILDRIACVHMSGLLVRSHMNAERSVPAIIEAARRQG